jgi:hypothetical protein
MIGSASRSRSWLYPSDHGGERTTSRSHTLHQQQRNSAILSGACCLASPLAFASSRAVLLGLLAIWGVAVIADSAQFSAAVTELAEPRYAGSILALQLALGFAFTAGSIRLVPAVVGGLGWQLAILPLAIGPLLGTVAMLRLRATPAANCLASGRNTSGDARSCAPNGRTGL